MPAGSESLTIVLYGDNRPGFRMETHAVELAAARGLTSKDPAKWPRGLLFLPIILIEAIVPTLDGPRDLVTLFTHRPSGGREKGVRALPHQAVEIGGLRGQDGVVAGLGTPAPTIENAQHSGSLTPPRLEPRGWAYKIHRKRNPEL
jgi:hypothetical protein